MILRQPCKYVSDNPLFCIEHRAERETSWGDCRVMELQACLDAVLEETYENWFVANRDGEYLAVVPKEAVQGIIRPRRRY